MKHPSTRALFEYWNARRGSRPAPERCEIDPAAIRTVLADTFILGLEGRTGHPFRIAGTRVCAAFGRELKNEDFIELWRRDDRVLIGKLLTVVTRELIGFVACAHVASEDGELDFELLVLPLEHRGRSDVRLLGALGAAELPYWFGMRVLSPLALGPHRFLLPELCTEAMRRLDPGWARLVRGLVVYDGGLSVTNGT